MIKVTDTVEYYLTHLRTDVLLAALQIELINQAVETQPLRQVSIFQMSRGQNPKCVARESALKNSWTHIPHKHWLRISMCGKSNIRPTALYLVLLKKVKKRFYIIYRLDRTINHWTTKHFHYLGLFSRPRTDVITLYSVKNNITVINTLYTRRELTYRH